MKERINIFKTKPIALILIFVMIFQYISIIIPFFKVVAEPSDEEYETTVDGITWTYRLDGGNAVLVYPSNNEQMVGNIVMPGSMDGHTVTSIEENAFEDCEDLTGITLPDSITSIGSYAFSGCSGLVNVNIPTGLTKIEENLFESCTSLANINIPQNIQIIGKSSFSGCTALTNIVIPEGVTQIEASAFTNCTGLTSITIPNSVTSFNGSIFNGCTALTNIILEPDNTNYSFENGVLYNKNKTSIIRYLSSNQNTEFTIPSSVESIGSSAFSKCTALTNVIIPNSVTSIEGSAFANCTGLTTIEIPNSVTTIGMSAFYGCTGLTSANIPDSVTSMGNNVFYNCKGLTSISLSHNINSLGDYAFYGCIGLTNITIPGNIETIGKRAFQSCTGLTDVTLEQGVKTILDRVFYSCTNLKNLTLSEGLETIGSIAFSGCNNLEEVVVPEGVTSISNAFSGCRGLKKITLPGSLDTINGIGMLTGCTSLETIEITEGLTLLKANAFSNLTGLKTVILPNSITNIETLAFNGCTNLENINIPTGLTTLNKELFIDTNLKNITIPANIITIGNSVFSGCSNLTNVTFSEGLNSIGNSVFSNCTSLTNVTLPNSITTMGTSTFSGCTGLTTVTLPNNITSINNSTFSGCTSLASIDIPQNVTSIGSYAFKDCTSLNSINIPDGVTNIEQYAFSNCTNLASIDIPTSVTNLGTYAFSNCDSLTSVIIPGNITSIENNTFNNCDSLTDIQIEEGVTSIGSFAFYPSPSNTTIVIPNSITSIGNNFAWTGSTTIKCYKNSYAYNFARENGFKYDILDDDEIVWSYTVSSGNAVNIKPQNKSTVGEIVELPVTIDGYVVKSIASNAFSGCTSLKNVDFGSIFNSYETIGSLAFSGCTSLEYINLKNINTIGSSAFAGCTSLETIDLQSVRTIESWAFKGCTSLNSMEIPSSVTQIKNYAFDDCISLETFNVDGYNNNYSSEDGVLYNKDKTKLIRYPQGKQATEFTIPNTVTSIEVGAFKGCTNLTQINIPTSVTSIGDEAFYGCTGLTNITIPNSVTSVETSIFRDCTGLTSVNLSNSMNTITADMFYNCTNLTNLEISENISTIAQGAFWHCTNLEEIIIKKDYMTINNNVFNYCPNLTIVCFKDSSAHYYANNNDINVRLIIQTEDENLYNKLKEVLEENYEIKNDNSEEFFFSMSEVDINSITSLDLSNAGIEYDLEILDVFENLEELDVSHNNLDYVPTGLTLKKLNMSYNIISDVYGYSAYDIEELDLSYNDISILDYLYPFENVYKLNLDGNHIYDIKDLDEFYQSGYGNLEKLSLRNQTLDKEVIKREYSLSDIAPILEYAITSVYKNGENVTFETLNCSVNNGKVTLSNNLNSTDTFATITVRGGLMDGTVCQIKPSSHVFVDYYLSGDNLELYLDPYSDEYYEDFDSLELRYSINGGSYYLYKDKIILNSGINRISVKFFDEELLNEEITVDVPVVLKAYRKNGKIYLMSNAKEELKYSFSQDGEFSVYSSAIEDSELHEKIYVKIGNDDSITEVDIQNISLNLETEYNISDVQTGRNNAFENEYVKRVNGKLKIANMNITHYSYDDYNWYVFQGTDIQDLGSKYLYIRYLDESLNVIEDALLIIDENKLSQTFGVYNENGTTYAYSQERTNVKNSNETNVINDENKVGVYDINVIDTADFHGNVFVLSDEGNVYRISNNNERIEVSGGVNIKQIDGVFAVNNNNEILKCNYTGSGNSTIEYSVCGEFLYNKQIEKILCIRIENEFQPLVLFEDGTCEMLLNGGNNVQVSNYVIDVAAEDDTVYILKEDTVEFIINPTENIYKYSIGMDLADFLQEGEVATKINKQGIILTNNGNLYKANFYKEDIVNGYGYEIPHPKRFILESYDSNCFATNVKQLGDYSYQDNQNNIYYISRVEITEIIYGTHRTKYDFEYNVANRRDDNRIVVTKDESKINEDKVTINVQVPEGVYTVKLPNGNTVTSSTTFEVNQNGVYTFEFTNSNGYKSIKVVHVTNIQSRKQTKIPEVSVVNGKVSLECENETIMYSVDEKQTWNTYTDVLTYENAIYAKIDNDEFECSILKITIDENGNLSVENEEDRKINGNILTNGLGTYLEGSNNKVIEISKQVSQIIANTQAETSHAIINLIYEKTGNLIYSLSTVDGKYAGCYFEEPTLTEITYKDINGNVSNIENSVQLNNIAENSQNKTIDYAIIKDNYICVVKSDYENLLASGEEITDEKLEAIEYDSSNYEENEHIDTVNVVKNEKNYVYLDNTGNLYSNISCIERAKQHIGPNNCVKIVGDGHTFYILTKNGEVYEVSEVDSGYMYVKLNKEEKYYSKEKFDNKYNIIYKLEINNIVDIFDTCTAKTIDGEIVSLIEHGNYSKTIVEEIEAGTEKYLLASHLGLKSDGTLKYYKENVTGGKIVAIDKNGRNVKLGKIVLIDSKEKAIGIFSNKENKIKLFNNPENLPDLDEANEESYVILEEDENQSLPKFVDIAEYRNSNLTDIFQKMYLDESTKVYIKYEGSDNYAKTIAVDEYGEIYLYFDGYVVDTGINFDFYGPTLNYNLSNSNWTNQNVDITLTANARSSIVESEIKKDTNRRGLSSGENTVQNIDETLTAETNGIYNYSATDSKGRSYSGSLAIRNIDKLKPITPEIKTVDRKLQIDFKQDAEATDDNGMSGIKERLISYDGENWTEVSDNVVSLEVDLDTIVYAKSIDNAGNESDIASGSLEKGTLRIKYLDETGTGLVEDDVDIKVVGTPYNVTAKEIEHRHILEDMTEGDLQGTYINGETVIKFYYEKDKYTVRFNANDGTQNPATKDQEMTYETDGSKTKLAKNTFERTGYSFVKWYENSDITGEDYEDEEEVSNLTSENGGIVNLYAQWNMNPPVARFGTVTVKYYDLAENTLTEDDTLSGPEGMPYTVSTKEIAHYHILEDKTVGDLQGTYTDGEIVIKLYYAIDQYRVTFYDEDGETELDKVMVDYAKNASYTKETPTKADDMHYTYIFNGWDNPEKLKNITEDRSVKATYVATAKQYIVRFNANYEGADAEVKEQTMTYDKSEQLAENTFTREGYTFKNWNVNVDGTGDYYNDKQEVTNLTTISNGIVNLYAQWNKNSEPEPETGKVIVKYQDENGKAIKDDVVLEGIVGKDYKTEKAKFDIYEFVKVEGNEIGKYTKDEQIVIYKYNKKIGRVIIIYNNPDGEKIKENDIVEGKIDTNYKLKRQEVEGYELIEVKGNEEGKFKLEDQVVLYKFKKIEKQEAMPQTGESRIAYIAVGIIIIISAGGIICIKIKDLKSKK